jgi:hypothetical protein
VSTPMFTVMVCGSTLRVCRYIIFAAEIMDDDDEEPPVGSLATEKTEGDLHPSDSLSPPGPETTEQPPTSASS